MIKMSYSIGTERLQCKLYIYKKWYEYTNYFFKHTVSVLLLVVEIAAAAEPLVKQRNT